ncbi:MULTISPECIES: hypothetical protein [unclassified Rhizobium]|jgi:hypothetical protein|nr:MULTISPECIES: hypothetical protein [unclassified Rhizobium]
MLGERRGWVNFVIALLLFGTPGELVAAGILKAVLLARTFAGDAN